MFNSHSCCTVKNIICKVNVTFVVDKVCRIRIYSPGLCSHGSPTARHNLGLDPTPFLQASTSIQANSPKGPISIPCSLAFALLACLTAYLAAIPCMMTLFLKHPKASPQALSARGSQPAVSAYHSMHWACVGRPGVCEEG